MDLERVVDREIDSTPFMPYIPSDESSERARQYFEEHPTTLVAVFGTLAVAFGIAAFLFFRVEPPRFVFSRWGALLLAALFGALCLHRVVTLWAGGKP